MEAKDIYKEGRMPSVYIRFKGVWDMQDLYESMINFFRTRKYKFHEKKHKHKRLSPHGAERQYVWSAERKEDEYLQFFIDIFVHTYDAHDVEVVMKDGSTEKFTKGRLWIEFRGHMLFDYQKRWEKNAFYANLRNFYHKYVMRKKIENVWWDQLWYREIHQLHALVKERLKMASEGYAHRYWTGVHK